jgi:hypothetical protein
MRCPSRIDPDVLDDPVVAPPSRTSSCTGMVFERADRVTDRVAGQTGCRGTSREQRSWNRMAASLYEGGVTTPRDRVLLVAGLLATPLGPYDAAELALRCGVCEALVAGIRVTGVDTSQFIDAFF